MRRLRGLIGPLSGFLGVVVVILAWRRIDVVEVRGRSMDPTLHPADRLLAVRLRRAPRAGEIVLAPDPRDPSRELVKRVESVDSSGVRLRGDNPAFSTDARVFGAIAAGDVRWLVIARYWPLTRAGRLGPAPPLALVDEGGEPACAFPGSLIAG